MVIQLDGITMLLQRLGKIRTIRVKAMFNDTAFFVLIVFRNMKTNWGQHVLKIGVKSFYKVMMPVIKI